MMQTKSTMISAYGPSKDRRHFIALEGCWLETTSQQDAMVIRRKARAVARLKASCASLLLNLDGIEARRKLQHCSRARPIARLQDGLGFGQQLKQPVPTLDCMHMPTARVTCLKDAQPVLLSEPVRPPDRPHYIAARGTNVRPA